MGNGLRQDDPEKSAAVGVAKRIGRLILAPVDCSHAHFHQAENRGSESQGKTDHRHRNTADGYFSEDNIKQDHKKHHYRHSLHQPYTKPGNGIGGGIAVAAEQKGAESQRCAKKNREHCDEECRIDALYK